VKILTQPRIFRLAPFRGSQDPRLQLSPRTGRESSVVGGRRAAAATTASKAQTQPCFIREDTGLRRCLGIHFAVADLRAVGDNRYEAVRHRRAQ
jgi:hypothetical protein